MLRGRDPRPPRVPPVAEGLKPVAQGFDDRRTESPYQAARDLIADATGALTTLVLTWFVRCFTAKGETADQPPVSQV